MRSFVLIFLCFVFAGCSSIPLPKSSESYAQQIVGSWGHKNRIITFHADGSWGVQRHESARKKISGRRWRVDGDKFILTFPSSKGAGMPVHMVTNIYTITSCTSKRFIIKENDGYTQTYDRQP